MPSTTVCPVTGRALAIPDKYRGKRVRCRGCGAEFIDSHPPAPLTPPPNPPPGPSQVRLVQATDTPKVSNTPSGLPPQSNDRGNTPELPSPDSIEKWRVQDVLQWYTERAKPLLQRLDGDATRELDADHERIKEIILTDDRDLEVCFLGIAGIGKSTLINALVAVKERILPSGGVGPLTAQALRVCYGDVGRFEAEYHTGDRLNQLVFGLKRRLEQQPKEGTAAEAGLATVDDETADADQRTASVLVTGDQASPPPPDYLIDSLCDVLGQKRDHGTNSNPKDEPRLERLRKALGFAEKHESYSRSATEDFKEFRQDLKDHAAGFLAPLIKTLTVSWPSPLLRDGIQLIDLPGVGAVSDAYRRLTFDWLRERARGLVLVVGKRGLLDPDIEVLRISGFLNRLVYAADDPTVDPVVLLVAITHLDEVARDRYDDEGEAGPSLAAHFEDVFREAVDRRRDEVRNQLARVWPPDDAHPENVRREIVDRLAKELRVHPVSALQYRALLTEDPLKFISTADQSGIPQLQESLRYLVRERRRHKAGRLRELREVFCSQTIAKLRIHLDRWQREEQSVQQTEQLRGRLESFLKQLSEEFKHRQGAFREFLRGTLPARIEAVIDKARERARKDIETYLNYLGKNAHHRTLQAAIDRAAKGESFKGQNFPRIDLPQEFALRFEEPVAEAWGKQILTDIRRRTKQYAEDCLELVDKVVEWAQQQAGEVPIGQVEAQREALRADARKLELVGRETANRLRGSLRDRLVAALRSPVQQGCKEFVDAGKNEKTGLRDRILDLLGELAETVTQKAAETAIQILRTCFGEVEKEIKPILESDKDPLAAAADALLSARQHALQQHGAVERKRIAAEIQSVLDSSPCPANDSTT